MKNKTIQEFIENFISEYVGTGASGGNAGDGNSITSPRPFPNDTAEILSYTLKSIYGGDGGHYKGEPVTQNPNRVKMAMFEDLKNLIKKELKEQAYGSATLTTQGPPRTGVIAPTDEYPFSKRPKRTATGMMEFKQPKSFDPDTIRLVREMLEVADIHHNELVDDADTDEISTFLDKRSGGTFIKFPHYNGPGPRSLFGKDVSDQIARSKAAAKAAALKVYTKFKTYIEDYEISDKSPAGVYGNIYLFIMFNDLAKDYSPPKGGTQSTQLEENKNLNEHNQRAQELADSYSVEELQDRLDQIMREMEQEAEPEGGPVADMYADEIQSYEDAIKIVKGDSGKELTYGQATGQEPLPDGTYLDKKGKKTTVAPNKDAFTKSSKFDKLNEDNKKLLDKIEKKVIQILKKEGGAAGLAPLKKAVDKMDQPKGFSLKSTLQKMKNVVKHKNSDYILTPIKEQAPPSPPPGGGGGGTPPPPPPAGGGGGAPPPAAGGGGTPTDPDARAEQKELLDLERKKFSIKIKYLNRKKAKASAQAAKASSAAIKGIQKQVDQLIQQRGQVGQQKENKIMKTNKLLSDYLKHNKNVNLKSKMNEHRKLAKRQMLMEGALKQFFEMFDAGRTDEEIVQDYASKGVSVPETFVKKARGQYESLTKLKTELEMTEKEFKNDAKQIVNNPVTGEADMLDDDKQLASGILDK